MSELSEIINRLTSIEIKIGVFENKLDNIHSLKNSIHESMQAEIKNLNTIVMGNEKPGLTHHVTRIEEIAQLLNTHILTDRWVYGFFLVIQGWILARLYLIK